MMKFLRLCLLTLAVFVGAAHYCSADSATDQRAAVEGDPLDVALPLAPFELAITVDDLPVHSDLPPGMTRQEVAEKIIAAFAAMHMPPVYGFSNGEQLTWEPTSLEVLKMWQGSGNALGNHTFSHIDLAATTSEAYIVNIVAMEAVLRYVAPQGIPRAVFRYPFLSEGDTIEKRNAVRDFLTKRGYAIAQVTVDYFDWAWSSAYTRCAIKQNAEQQGWLRLHVIEAARRHVRRSQQIAKLLTGHSNTRHILLLHLSAMNAVILSDLLKALQDDGVQFISLERAMADPIYQMNPNQPFPDGRSFLEQLIEAGGQDHPYEEQKYTVDVLNEVCKD